MGSRACLVQVDLKNKRMNREKVKIKRTKRKREKEVEKTGRRKIII